MRLVWIRARFVRAWIAVAVCGLLMAVAASSASAAGFGIKNFEAGTCSSNTPECTYATTSQFYTQAAGHPNYGITDFTFKTVEPVPGVSVPVGNVKDLRVDLPAGLSVNPQALPECSMEEFGEHELEIAGHIIEIGGHPSGFYPASTCKPETELGTDVLTVVLEGGVKAHLLGTVYNLVQPQKVPAEFGVAVDVTSILEATLKTALPPGFAYIHTFLEGGVSWHSETLLDGTPVETSGDYHEYFNIDNISSALPLVESRLIFNGRAGTGFLTMPSECGKTTTKIWVESYEGETEVAETPAPADVSGCASVPFQPKVKVEPSTTQSDQPDGATVRVIVPQSADPEAIDSSAMQTAEVTLPEGMTLNPAAADGLEACTDEQFGKGTDNPVTCPAESQIGTVEIETPTLPKGSLTGNIYVGKPLNNVPSSGKDYRIFIDAESVRYGVGVRLEGQVKVNESTGRLTTLVTENPQTPFSEFILKLSNGAHTPLANPLSCGAATTGASFFPYTAPGVATLASFPFAVDSNGKGGACASPLPFALTQSTSALPTTGGSNTSFTLNLARGDGQQYLSKVSATLPEGVVAMIPSVPLCGDAEVASDSCPAASQIGTAEVELGSGASPYRLSGTVYLTGPYDGAPYGLAVVVPAEKVGPYDYGKITTRAAINIDPYTTRVTVTSSLPTIVGGVPLRLRSLTVNVTHASFMLNPTSCNALTTNTTLTSTLGSTQMLSSPFQATGCSALPFKPTFKAFAGARTSRKMGAGLKVVVTLPAGQANIRSVVVTLPGKLPSRQSTLKQACLQATFEANPFSCPIGSRVGGASVQTPTLPGTLTGPAYIVSHGGSAYPDLDLVLKGDGVTVILVGNTKIKNGITHSKFLSVPDVPFTTFKLKLPRGDHSILGAAGNFCKRPMYMPTTIRAQNGEKITQKTRIHVTDCPVMVLHKRVRREGATLTVKTPSAGRVSTGGSRYLRSIGKQVRKGGRAKIQARLNAKGVRALMRRHLLKVRVRVGFVPKRKHGRASKAFVTIVFRAPASGQAALHFRGRG